MLLLKELKTNTEQQTENRKSRVDRIDIFLESRLSILYQFKA